MNVPDVEVRKVGNEETQELIDFLKNYELRVPPEYNIKYLPWISASFKRDSLQGIVINSNEQIDKGTDIATIYPSGFSFPTPYGDRRFISPFEEDKTYLIERGPGTGLSGEIEIRRLKKDGDNSVYPTGIPCSLAFSRMQSLVKRDEDKIDIVNLGNVDIELKSEYEGKRYSIII